MLEQVGAFLGATIKPPPLAQMSWGKIFVGEETYLGHPWSSSRQHCCDAGPFMPLPDKYAVRSGDKQMNI